MLERPHLHSWYISNDVTNHTFLVCSDSSSRDPLCAHSVKHVESKEMLILRVLGHILWMLTQYGVSMYQLALSTIFSLSSLYQVSKLSSLYPVCFSYVKHFQTTWTLSLVSNVNLFKNAPGSTWAIFRPLCILNRLDTIHIHHILLPQASNSTNLPVPPQSFLLPWVLLTLFWWNTKTNLALKIL